MPMAGLPASLAGSRVLNLGSPNPEDRDRFECLDAELVVEETSPLGHSPGPPGSFDFIHCAALPVSGRQLLVLSRLWRLAAPSASLLLGSRVLDDVAVSRYLGVEVTSAAVLEWVPGRLALRWMVESSGFDVLHWLAEEAVVSAPSTPFAYLAARRSNRTPACLEQAGSPSEGPSSIGDQRDDPYAQRVPG